MLYQIKLLFFCRILQQVMFFILFSFLMNLFDPKLASETILVVFKATLDRG